MIRAKINVSKILKDKLFKGEKGTYLDITLMENKDGTDQYGNDYMVVQDLGKEARERGDVRGRRGCFACTRSTFPQIRVCAPEPSGAAGAAFPIP